MTAKGKLALIAVAVAAALIVLAAAANSLAAHLGVSARERTPQELSELLRPDYRVFRPDGDGPFPTALLFSGCDGPKDNLGALADVLNEAGWAAVIVDSHESRGLLRAELWRLVCAGQILTGTERAGDVAVALADAREMDFVDSDRLALIGASHGGWAILDLLALHGRGRLPHGLSDWPPGGRGGVLDGVRAAVLAYPYCGMASRVWRRGWGEAVPVLFFLVEGDTITDEEDCRRIVTRMRAGGQAVEEIVFAGVTHGFDQETKSQGSTLAFAPETATAMREAIIGFLAREGG